MLPNSPNHQSAMESLLEEIYVEETMQESLLQTPRLQDMMSQIGESTDPAVSASFIRATNEGQSLNQAILFSEVTESHASTTASSASENVSAPTTAGPETIYDVLNSCGRRLSLALNSPRSSTVTAFTPGAFDAAFTQSSTGQLVDTTQPIIPPTAGLFNTAATVSTKKPHIMISYNKSCREICLQIRNRLKALRYIVWMDIYDMRNNFIEDMAQAVSNSYIALLCLNDNYDRSPWCRKEAESISIQRIEFISCFMQAPYKPADWLALLLGANIRVDFSNTDQFEEAFQKLLRRITYLEEDLATSPRESLPCTPMINFTTSVTPTPTPATFDAIFRQFTTWVEENRDSLRRTDGQQSARLIRELIQGLTSDPSASDDENKRELLLQLLSATSHNQTDLLPRLIRSCASSSSSMVKGLLFIMALWAVKVIFRQD